MTPLPRRTMIALGLLGVASLPSCLSPTLPTPPPNRPDTIGLPDDLGRVRLQGTLPVPEVTVMVHNRRTELVFGQYTPSGHYDFYVQAERGDLLSLWYEDALEQSSPVVFIVPEASPADATGANPDAGMGDAEPDAP